MNVRVVAHRGNSSLAPENTLPAFESAAEAGADMIEIDIRVSADGVAVVIHDDTVDRTTNGTGPVAGLPVDELQHLDAGAWFDPAFAGVGVPVFSDVVDLLVRSPELGLLLEFKDVWTSAHAETVLAAIDETGSAERVLAQSASVKTLATLRELAPDLRLGLLIGRFGPEVLGVCSTLGLEACNPEWALALQPDVLTAIRSLGLDVYAWTPNEQSEWERLVAAGVDGIITDHPDRLRDWLAADGSTPPSGGGGAATGRR